MIGPAVMLLTDIGQLVTNTGTPGTGEASLGLASHQALLIDDGVITMIGAMDEPWVRDSMARAQVLSMAGSCVIPGFVDSHTHLIHGGDRLGDFVERMSGGAYQPGGIHTTVEATRAASDRELRDSLSRRVRQALEQGTTTIEVKTGYGLDVENEVRLARIANDETGQVTFLGAHVVPREFEGRREEYIDLVCGEMLQAVGPYVRSIDVFIEEGAFSVDEARRILTAQPISAPIMRMHASQLGPGDGPKLAVELGVASLDHATYLTDEDVALLADSDVVVTLLPGTEFATRSPYPDARRLLDAGVTIAIASNCNPGSGYSSSMPLMVALAVREMGMSPADALWSATRGGAMSLCLEDRGVIREGMRADLVQLDAPHYAYLAYRPGMPLVKRVFQAGEVVVDNEA